MIYSKYMHTIYFSSFPRTGNHLVGRTLLSCFNKDDIRPIIEHSNGYWHSQNAFTVVRDPKANIISYLGNSLISHEEDYSIGKLYNAVRDYKSFYANHLTHDKLTVVDYNLVINDLAKVVSYISKRFDIEPLQLPEKPEVMRDTSVVIDESGRKWVPTVVGTNVWNMMKRDIEFIDLSEQYSIYYDMLSRSKKEGLSLL